MVSGTIDAIIRLETRDAITRPESRPDSTDSSERTHHDVRGSVRSERNSGHCGVRVSFAEFRVGVVGVGVAGEEVSGLRVSTLDNWRTSRR
jgi:hypothetical protein